MTSLSHIVHHTHTHTHTHTHLSVGVGVEPRTKFSKRGGLDSTSTFREGLWERGDWLFSGGVALFT